VLNREPVLIQEVIHAGVALGVAFGLNFTGEQVALIMVFTAAVLGAITRQRVTPIASPNLSDGYVPGDADLSEL
jgi:hypothetical protein